MTKKTMTTHSLLVELLTEELPPKALKRLGEAFAQGIARALQAAKLADAGAQVTAYATPRRLAVHIAAVADKGPDEPRREKVLPVSVAFDAAGTPQPPLLKKLAAMGLSEADIPTLERAMDGKAQALFAHTVARGATLAEALQAALDGTLSSLPIPKVMFYERDDGTPVHFVRPAHKLIALHGDSVLGVQALGLQAGRTTQGHRFHSSGEIVVPGADGYEATLRTKGKVIAGFAERRAAIVAQLQALAQGDEIIMPDALLDEVTALVEWPKVYECHFDAQFLQVPQECLILTMQTNQKYFAVQRGGKLTHRFLIVSNIDTADPSAIIGGNERVVRPRLADAKFFFDQDRKHTLESRLPKLDSVVYHNKLGSQGERNKRVTAISVDIATQLRADVDSARRAAQLSKADLVTDMVGEFPELQGVMGEYYARHDGESAEVAQAIREHYLPRFAGDALPATKTGTIVALADKLETLAGMFAIGAQPTGDKDPYALRRHALGVVRLLVEKRLDIQVRQLVDIALGQLAVAQPQTQEGVLTFIYERAASYAKDLGYGTLVVEAVLSNRPLWLSRLPQLLEAAKTFAELPEAAALAAANKRISNILKKAADDVPNSETGHMLLEPAERELWGMMNSIIPDANRLYDNDEFTSSLRLYAKMKDVVDSYFDNVMVNVEDSALRINRLATLKRLHSAMNRVADLSKLAA